MSDPTVQQRLGKLGDKFQNDLIEWLKIPSISSDPRSKEAVRKAGKWAAELLQSGGLAVEIIETEGHPLVFAQSDPVPDAPIVLVYGHYDVQPVEPLDQWISGPFEPEIRDGNIYARGATDDKGQVLTHIESVLTMLAEGGKLPVQVKFLIEGEEEVGSENLENLLASLREKLACDVVVISDSSQFAAGQPAITYGLRGIATFELRLDGPSQDLHSGSFGGAVTNPGLALCQMLGAAVDSHGQVQIPGFYDNVRPISDLELGQLAELPYSDAEFAKSIGVEALGGDTRFSALERRWSRPTFEVNGLTCGHQGEGVKTIVPATASAKISCRLVPDQDPEQIAVAVEEFFRSKVPPGVRLTFKRDHIAPGMLARLNSPYMTAARQAIEAAFGTAPVMIREGGSIPIVTKFQEVLGADCLLLGWGLNDDNAHSPNEKFKLADFHRGIAASIALWDEIGKIQKA